MNGVTMKIKKKILKTVSKKKDWEWGFGSHPKTVPQHLHITVMAFTTA